MDLTVGLIFIAVAVAMLVVARPSNGISAPFLKNWVVGQAYGLTTLGSIVLGVTVIIVNWPF